MKKVTLVNFKNDKVYEFDCIDYEIEKGYYKFYISSRNIKYFPAYDFILDVVYPKNIK